MPSGIYNRETAKPNSGRYKSGVDGRGYIDGRTSSPNYQKDYRGKNIKKLLVYSEKYRLEHKKEKAIIDSLYYFKNKKAIRIKEKKYRKANIEKFREYARKYRINNLEKMRKCARKCQQKRLLIPMNRINAKMSRVIYASLKNNMGSKPLKKRIGYTTQELRVHIENQFDRKMSWANYGSYWELDHIKPKSLFSFEDMKDEEFKKCWALSNLQPLSSIDNRIKHTKFYEKKQECNKEG